MAEAVRVFFSYSHEDEELRNKLAKHLSILKRNGVISEWHDRQIEAGSEWAEEIDTQLNNADIILLLISASFLSSDYCWGVELEQAMARHRARDAYVIPVILRPVYWKGAPFGELQALPRNAQPITKWTDQDEALMNVADGVSKAAERLQTLRSRSTTSRFLHETIEPQQTSRFTSTPASSSQQPSSTNQPNQPPASVVLPRRQFLKWAIPAGLGVAGVTIFSQLTKVPSQPTSPSSSPSPSTTTEVLPQIASSSPSLSPSSSPTSTDDDYSELERDLKAGNWQGADQKTSSLILKVVNREKEGTLDTETIRNFPCDVLNNINRLWVDNSDGKFGFSVQRKIYEGCGGKLISPNDEETWQYNEEIWQCFGNKVGWRVNNQWIKYTDHMFDNIDKALDGFLPSFQVKVSFTSPPKPYFWVLLSCVKS